MFSIASAPVIRQQAMDKVLQGTQRTQYYLNDINVTAKKKNIWEIWKRILDYLEGYGLLPRCVKYYFLKKSYCCLLLIVDMLLMHKAYISLKNGIKQ